jgi:hypothetical protein
MQLLCAGPKASIMTVTSASSNHTSVTARSLPLSAARLVAAKERRGETTDDHINQKDKRGDNSIGIIAGGWFDR